MMATKNRGQSPARQTKVMDSYPGPVKKGRNQKIRFCDNEALPSKPVTIGRGLADDSQTKSSCKVTKCGKSRCKTCKHIVEGDSFVSNVTGKRYNVSSTNTIMSCNTRNVIYLISCKRCGIQYVGETSQALRSRINNHRNRLKSLCGLYLYQHFCSDGHSEEDISVMPLEEVKLEEGECNTLTSKRLKREDYWYRELGTIYPYGLNDNVKRIGNISKSNNKGIVVWTLFNKQKRKFRRRPKKKMKRNKNIDVEGHLRSLLSNY